jgi:putative DNA primase/helicase
MQRFQLAVYPDPPGSWRNVDRWPNHEARDRGMAVFRRLDRLTPADVGEGGEGGLPFLRFDAQAQELFDEWHAALMARLRAGGEHPAIESHLGKYRSLMPSLALLFHLVDAAELPPGPVSLAAAQRAAAWCDFLEQHARRLYQAVADESVGAAKLLLERIRAGRLPAPFGAWQVRRQGWAGLSESEAVNDALEVLAEHGWLRRVEVRETGGAPRVEFHPHPSLTAGGNQ